MCLRLKSWSPHLLMILLTCPSSFAHQTAPKIAARLNATQAQRDISGGAALIFNNRPQNPTLRPKSSDLSEEFEDALALANRARDANPPRYEDAEMAYRLAAKLNPNDPRPYVGLGNVSYDRKQFAEAAKLYKQAVLVMARDSSANKRTVRGWKTSASTEENATVHFYVGTTLLQAGNFSDAEIEFRKALGLSSNNANWHAQMGYCLLKQKKFVEASKSLQRAHRLDPKPEYEQLLQLSLNRRTN